MRSLFSSLFTLLLLGIHPHAYAYMTPGEVFGEENIPSTQPSFDATEALIDLSPAAPADAPELSPETSVVPATDQPAVRQEGVLLLSPGFLGIAWSAAGLIIILAVAVAWFILRSMQRKTEPVPTLLPAAPPASPSAIQFPARDVE